MFYRFGLVYWQAGKWFYFTNFNGIVWTLITHNLNVTNPVELLLRLCFVL
jgi:hypothetical protein